MAPAATVETATFLTRSMNERRSISPWMNRLYASIASGGMFGFVGSISRLLVNCKGRRFRKESIRSEPITPASHLERLRLPFRRADGDAVQPVRRQRCRAHRLDRDADQGHRTGGDRCLPPGDAAAVSQRGTTDGHHLQAHLERLVKAQRRVE